MQSKSVDQFGASQHLEVIRTLMERSAIYRRALTPIMLTLGVVGIGAGLLGYVLDIEGSRRFSAYWLAVSVVALATAYLQMRAQAIKDHEEFWSPPTRRVTQAIAPALFAGGVLATGITFVPERLFFVPPGILIGAPGWQLPPIWMLLYGCAIHAAGFFMPRGFRLFGWAYIVAGAGVFVTMLFLKDGVSMRLGHLFMAIAFGGPHLAYGIYLAITKRRNEM